MRIRSTLLPGIAMSALGLCTLPLAGCTQSPGIRAIPPPPEPVRIDLSNAGVVIFKVRIDPDQQRDFKPSSKNLIWLFDDGGATIGRVVVDDNRRKAINDKLTTGFAEHAIRYDDSALRTAIDHALASGKQLDVLLTLAYGTKGVAGITGHAASFAPAIPTR